MRADYDPIKQEWFIESTIALSYVMKVRVVNFLKQNYSIRIKGEIGERKKRMIEAVDKLTAESLVVRLEGNGDKTLYLDPTLKLNRL